MPVTRDEVVWAYRLLLGREPESEDAIANWVRVEDRRELVWNFLMSAEARSRPIVQTLDQFVHECDIEVEVRADQEQMSNMISRIGRAWSAFGETQPHWSVITHENFTIDRIADHVDEFYDSGRGVADRVVATLCRNGVDPGKVESVLDFGCGVGRLSFALREVFPKVLGADISPGHLVVARERAAETGLVDVGFVLLKDVDDVLTIPSVDLIVSFIVLQHNPPPIAVGIISRLLSLLNPGGVAVFQIPTFIKGYRFSIAEYLTSDQPQMEMNAVPQKIIFETIHDSECAVLEVREDLCAGNMLAVSQTFVVLKL
jgi:SAM-dependent methyltransferase